MVNFLIYNILFLFIPVISYNYFNKYNLIKFNTILYNKNKNLDKETIFFLKNEDDIINDSLEGFLKLEFYKIADNTLINNKKNIVISFNTFYSWRKKVGTILYKEELLEIFLTITNNNNFIDLIDFILINIIIDENDSSYFS